ncbi:MAG: hypothetical protein AAB518_02590 [Patescibacteria group bacterium]
MLVTKTALAFIVLGLGLAFCGWRFLKAFRKAENPQGNRKIGLLLTLFFFTSSIQTAGIIGLGSLFLAENLENLYYVSLAANIFLSTFAVLGVYTMCYVFFPKIKLWIPIIFVLALDLLGVVLTVLTHPIPIITSGGNIDWNLGPALSLVTFTLLLLGIGAQSYIFINLFSFAKGRELRITSLFLAISSFGAVIAQFINFILLRKADAFFRTNIYDGLTVLTGILFLVGLGIIPFFKGKPVNSFGN